MPVRRCGLPWLLRPGSQSRRCAATGCLHRFCRFLRFLNFQRRKRRNQIFPDFRAVYRRRADCSPGRKLRSAGTAVPIGSLPSRREGWRQRAPEDCLLPPADPGEESREGNPPPLRLGRTWKISCPAPRDLLFS